MPSNRHKSRSSPAALPSLMSVCLKYVFLRSATSCQREPSVKLLVGEKQKVVGLSYIIIQKFMVSRLVTFSLSMCAKKMLDMHNVW